jgi:hypothetical protein
MSLIGFQTGRDNVLRYREKFASEGSFSPGIFRRVDWESCTGDSGRE